MKVLVYPHSMELGGSQLNAIELAAAVRDRGHDVLVYSESGPLVRRVKEMGLEHVLRRDSPIRPGPGTAVDLAGLVRTRDIDVIHGWEWPPILECFAAGMLRPEVSLVGSIMSMSVAPFIPSSVPLTVGTERIRLASAQRRRGPVRLLEPPVDTEANRPDWACGAKDLVGVPDSSARVVIVSRLVRELKLQGILTAIAAAGELAARREIQLVIVGDGPARAELSEAASVSDARAGRRVVFFTGELSDPRMAYATADICLGMGGSALRALAFAKPLVVQGEGGFFETLSAQNAKKFLADGWYGVASRNAKEACNHLCQQLEYLLDVDSRLGTLGAYGRQLVEDRFSLRGTAACLERFYLDAMARPPSWLDTARDAAQSGAGLVGYKVDRRLERRRGRARIDDFNAAPV